ncbi:hypothetical protein H6P81_007330 [Aristolochia fimbriata]|uniref:Uncharacterized protein n=1 Tax=Aristolochia fimbriata TaxID=158543 RepID=A0AAV7F3K9_ARIFI|nr:hypothetical protein H6P81_007330 [Aristolochia fimbriata]
MEGETGESETPFAPSPIDFPSVVARKVTLCCATAAARLLPLQSSILHTLIAENRTHFPLHLPILNSTKNDAVGSVAESGLQKITEGGYCPILLSMTRSNPLYLRVENPTRVSSSSILIPINPASQDRIRSEQQWEENHMHAPTTQNMAGFEGRKETTGEEDSVKIMCPVFN